MSLISSLSLSSIFGGEAPKYIQPKTQKAKHDERVTSLVQSSLGQGLEASLSQSQFLSRSYFARPSEGMAVFTSSDENSVSQVSITLAESSETVTEQVNPAKEKDGEFVILPDPEEGVKTFLERFAKLDQELRNNPGKTSIAKRHQKLRTLNAAVGSGSFSNPPGNEIAARQAQKIDRKRVSAVVVPSGDSPHETYGLTHFAVGFDGDNVLKAAINPSYPEIFAYSSEFTSELKKKPDLIETKQSLFTGEEEFVQVVARYSYQNKKKEEKFGTLMEYCPLSLQDVLSTYGKEDFSGNEKTGALVAIFRSLFSGMEKMEQKGVVHKAITPKNIMALAGQGKIGNWNSAHSASFLAGKEIAHLSPEYLVHTAFEKSPKIQELFQSSMTEYYTKMKLGAAGSSEDKAQLEMRNKTFERLFVDPEASSLDVWSAGVMMYEMIFQAPFYESVLGENGKTAEGIAQQMLEGNSAFREKIAHDLKAKKEKFKDGSDFQKGMIVLLQNALNPDPGTRISAERLKALFDKKFPVSVAC